MPDYANGKIYKIEPICDHEEGEIYFGSTTRRLCDRWGNHKWALKSNNKNKCSSIVLLTKYGIENCNILLVELVTANSKEELTAREAFYIRNNNCVNKYIPDRTKAEYQAKHKDKIAEYQAEYQANYYAENKDKIANKRAEKLLKSKA
jgi:hypothetical protein